MSIKRVLCPARVRRIPRQFSWVDQRLVRDEIIDRCGSDALALYLFLITVADAEGLSYYSDQAVVRRLSFEAGRLRKARCELMQVGLIAFEKPAFIRCWPWITQDRLSSRTSHFRIARPARSRSVRSFDAPWEVGMISYEKFCKIQDYHQHQGLTVTQIARVLGLDPKTVAKWIQVKNYRPRATSSRTSKLDPFKSQVVRLLESHPYSATQVFQRLREEGYGAGFSILKDYVRKVRPVRKPAFLTLSFEPGECAQVDWGEYGSVNVGNTRRRLSFFVMVLCYSRLMYLEFTVSQTLEHFLNCHQNAFQYFGGVVKKVMLDNLKTAVLQRLVGEAPVFNPRYRQIFPDTVVSISSPAMSAKATKKAASKTASSMSKRTSSTASTSPISVP